MLGLDFHAISIFCSHRALYKIDQNWKNLCSWKNQNPYYHHNWFHRHFFHYNQYWFSNLIFPLSPPPVRSLHSCCTTSIFLNPHVIKTNTFHSTNFFLCFSRYHVPTNSISPFFCTYIYTTYHIQHTTSHLLWRSANARSFGLTNSLRYRNSW